MVTGTSVAKETVFAGKSTFVRTLPDILRKMATCQYPLLITGESGTGKSVLAELAHQLREPGRLVKVDCPNVPETLLESELFGTRKGAFTGAANNSGMVSGHKNDTLWFDEVGDISPTVQAKLLGLLDGEFRPLGTKDVIPFSSKVIATTNADLPKAVEEKRFRQDLYFRLRMLRIHIPPLRGRREDILPLIIHFLNALSPGTELIQEPESVGLLMGHSWLGNARDIKSAVLNAILNADQNNNLSTEALIPYIRGDPNATTWAPAGESSSIFPLGVNDLGELECFLIKKALQQTEGNVSEAGKRLGLTRNTIRYRMQKYGIS